MIMLYSKHLLKDNFRQPLNRLRMKVDVTILTEIEKQAERDSC